MKRNIKVNKLIHHCKKNMKSKAVGLPYLYTGFELSGLLLQIATNLYFFF